MISALAFSSVSLMPQGVSRSHHPLSTFGRTPLRSFKAAFPALALFAVSILAGNPASAQSITISNSAAGSTTPGQKNTVTADVSVSSLSDGTYNVSVVVINQTAGGTTKTTKGTVTITNGKGSLSIQADFPTGAATDAGIIQLEVSDPKTGATDADEITFGTGA